MQPAVPQPIIAQQPDAVIVRQMAEECNDTLDSAQQDKTLRGRLSVTLDPLLLPTQDMALVRCTRSKTGALTITVKILKVR